MRPVTVPEPRPTPPDLARPAVSSVCFVCTGNICRSPMAAAVLQPTGRCGPDGATGRCSADHLVISQRRHRWLARRRADGPAGPAPRWSAGATSDHGTGPGRSSPLGSPPLTWSCAWTGAIARPCSDWPGPRPATTATTSAWSCCALRSRCRGAVDVPDPYYGDDDEFESCLDLVEAGCRGLALDLIGRVDRVDRSDSSEGTPRFPLGNWIIVQRR